ASAHLPIIVVGSAETAAAQFVRRVRVGAEGAFRTKNFRPAVAAINRPGTKGQNGGGAQGRNPRVWARRHPAPRGGSPARGVPAAMAGLKNGPRSRLEYHHPEGRFVIDRPVALC